MSVADEPPPLPRDGIPGPQPRTVPPLDEAYVRQQQQAQHNLNRHRWSDLIALTQGGEEHERHSLVLESLAMTLQDTASRFVIAGTPQLDVTSLREVLLAMDSETRELRATLAELEKRKADRKEVVFRHEMDEWIDRRCHAIVAPVIEDVKKYKKANDARVAKVETELAIERGKLSDASEVIAKHGVKIGNLSARLLKAETALIDKAEQSELDAFVEVTHRFMGKTREHLGQHDTELEALRKQLEKERAKLQAQVTANLAETRTIPPTVPDLETFHNWIAKNEALQAQVMKVRRRGGGVFFFIAW